MTTQNNTIVYFHIGRGGRFHNAGRKTFCGEKTIQEVLQIADSSGQWSFRAKENQTDIYNELKSRNLDNLIALFEKCRDEEDFTAFEERTGFELGKDVYIDSNGSELITVEEAETGVGSISWDGDYDTDICKLLSECDEEDLQLIADSTEWNKESLLQRYFDENTSINIDWSKFNGNYSDLITDFFNFPNIFAADYYEKEEVED